MTSLTPKQESFCLRYIETGNASEAYRLRVLRRTAAARRMAVQKLEGLEGISKTLHLIPSASDPPLPTSLQERRVQQVGVRRLLAALSFLLSGAPDPIRRTACRWLLDYAAPGWTRSLPTSLTGYTLERASPEVAGWRRRVLARDCHQCTRCGSRSGLHAHHILHWAKAPDMRVEDDNGITLCESCHMKEHGKETHRPRAAVRQ